MKLPDTSEIIAMKNEPLAELFIQVAYNVSEFSHHSDPDSFSFTPTDGEGGVMVVLNPTRSLPNILYHLVLEGFYIGIKPDNGNIVVELNKDGQSAICNLLAPSYGKLPEILTKSYLMWLSDRQYAELAKVEAPVSKVKTKSS